ncbi:nucleoside diphosphate kinase 6-like [Corticium candelabrum]|uniref:nucleoside diphosphate kinase 6-like n=1 Tax=Corticium candelabrum TaxID=121492 RepID=UPI002E256DB0|nr:nucleoside diphosphate kinase 6-like [Corticium candelabrum]
MPCSARLQLILAFLKPDICQHKTLVQEVTSRIVSNRFYVVRSKIVQLTRSQAEEFYFAHRGRFFFTRLVGMISSGPIIPLILARHNAVQQWRDMMGPTKTFRAKVVSPHTIRSQFGLTDTRNAVHGSDSIDSARCEISFFFPEFDFDKWMNVDEEKLRFGAARWDGERCIHRLQCD